MRSVRDRAGPVAMARAVTARASIIRTSLLLFIPGTYNDPNHTMALESSTNPMLRWPTKGCGHRTRQQDCADGLGHDGQGASDTRKPLELTDHRRFTLATNIDVYSAIHRAPWQRGSNENTNGLLRQYFPKGADLSMYSQAQLNKTARQLN